MGAIILKYPEDPTGVNPNNLVINEPHDLGSARNRAFVPNYGSYFTESMIVTEAATGRVLTKGVHYIAAQLQQDATLAMDKEICAVVVITDDSVRDSLLFTYQVVGGVFSTSVGALKKLIEALDLDERTVEWGGLIGIPSAFPPSPHLHDIGDVYGFEYLVEALEALRNAILIGDEAAHDELRQFINYQDGINVAAIAELRVDFEDHESNIDNPHGVTKEQLGLGSVLNYGVATQVEAQSGAANDRYMTPLRTVDAITQFSLVPLNAHVANINNPHATTKAQVGLSSVENYAPASQVEAQAGTANDRYMTPLSTKQSITVNAVVPLNTHINNQGNPHGVTKAQVGLTSVQDYAVATQPEAEVGTSNIKYMTPLRTANAIAAIAIVPLNLHINNLNNPHGTTKTQVGLGLVDNFATATAAEAQVGVVSTKFMTPLLTAQAITNQAGTAINNHVNNLNNPHGVTKTQVGLSSVDNFATATTAEAQAGTVSAKFMTPLLTAQAITTQAITPLNTHVANMANPHGTTKTQVGLSSIPNSITASRATNSDASLLTAKGMFDHVGSADHDVRYAPKNTPNVDCSVHWNGAAVFIWGGGTWRQVWPAQWA